MRVALVCCLLSAPAYGDNSSVHVTATGSVAATDNVFATDRSAAEPDMFMQIRPGMLWAYDAPRAMQQLFGEVEFLEYVLHSQRPSVTFRAGWEGMFLTGPRSQLTLGANGSSGQLNALTSRSSPDQTTVGVVPTGAIDTRQGTANEYFSYVAGKDSRISQSLFGTWVGTDDNMAMPTKTSSYQAGGNLGFDHTFRSDTFGIEAGAIWMHLLYIAPQGAIPGSRLDRQLNPHATAQWLHDWDKHWSTVLNGCAIFVNPYGVDPYNPTGPRLSDVYPIFGGTVAYVEQWGRVTVAARRAVAPNLLIAQNTVDDTLIAQLAMPLPWIDESTHLRSPKLLGMASIGAERTQLIDPMTSKENGEYQVGRLDAGVTWTPRPGQTWGLRYEFVYQHSSPNALAAVPAAATYWRNTLFLTFALRYPDKVAVAMPRHLESVRSDRKDLSPTGAEPVVPDPTDQPADEDSQSNDRR